MGQLVTSALEMWLGFILVFSLIEIIAGHGRLMEPPARNSMWRFGYGTPINYSDNEVFCGGVGSKYFKITNFSNTKNLLSTVRNLHLLSKNSTLISQENCRLFGAKNS